MTRYSTLRRTSFKKPSFAEALAKHQARERAKPRKELARGQKKLKPGPRMKEWRRAWNWLKPRLEAAGRVRCEFDFIIHECDGPLDPAHSKKRRETEGNDIYAVALACRKVHRILDEKLNHEQMEAAVMYAIERHGGLILPEIRKAA